MRLILLYLLCLTHCALANPHVEIAPTKQYSAGPYGFSASKVTVDGIDLGYVEKDTGPQSFGPELLVYYACDLSKPNEDFDGFCSEWKVFNIKTHQRSALKIPRFDSFTSIPNFVWPYVAYVETGEASNAKTRNVFCTVYDYQKRQVIKRIKVTVSEDTFATDYPGMFLKPDIATIGQKHFIRFYLDGAGDSPICAVSVTSKK